MKPMSLKASVDHVIRAAKDTGPENAVQALVFAAAQATLSLSEYDLAQVMSEARAQLKGGA